MGKRYINLPFSLDFESSDIPLIAKIEGVDLGTEGVITINRVLEYAKNYLFSIKINLVKELSECLKQIGKNIKVSYF